MNPSKPFTVAASVEGVTPRKDGGLTLRFVTQEISREEMVEVMNYYATLGWLLFSPNPLTEEVIPEKLATKGDKSPLQRLAAVMYVYWKQQTMAEPFSVYLERQVEKLIDKYKELLV